MENKYDCIVIGSGIGGMSCASALSRSGKKVLILEQHYVLGGMTHTFKRKKFEFDVGVHALGEMQENRMPGKLVNFLSGGELKMNSYGHPYETFHFPGDYKFEYPNEKEKYKENLIKEFPKEEDSIHSYFDLVNFIGKQTKTHFLMRSLPHVIDKYLSFIFKRKFNKWANQSVQEVLNSFFKDTKLKAILAGQWGYYGSIPSRASFFIHAIVTRHFWEGAFYPIGGSGEIAKTFLNAISSNHGQALTRHSAEELIIKNKKVIGVKTDKGNFYADTVVSAIGAKATVQNLAPEYLREKSWGKNISKLTQSAPHLCLYLGFDGDTRGIGATESNHWWCDTWEFEDAFWDLSKEDSEAPVLYISFPSLKDPLHTNNENHTCEVVTFANWDFFEKWKGTKVGRRGDDYKLFKEDIKNRLMKKLETIYPELMKKCIYSELSTPLSTDHFCRAPKGAIYGLEPTIERWKTTELRPKTPLKNFYMTGGDVGTLGVVGAMIGGVMTAAQIDKSIFKYIK